MKLKTSLTIVGFLLLCSVSHILAGDDSVLKTPIKRFSSGGGLEFEDLCRVAKLSCGLELATMRTYRKGQYFHANNETVEAILVRIASGPAKGYSWRVVDGVVEMAPSEVFSGKTTSALDKRLPAVDIDDEYAWRAVNKICEDAGVAVHASNFSGPTAHHEKISLHLHLKNVTVREALDAAVKQDGHVMWKVEPQAGGLVISVQSFRTPDKNDPLWKSNKK